MQTDNVILIDRRYVNDTNSYEMSWGFYKSVVMGMHETVDIITGYDFVDEYHVIYYPYGSSIKELKEVFRMYGRTPDHNKLFFYYKSTIER